LGKICKRIDVKAAVCGDSMKIEKVRKLGIEEIKKLYRECMQRDFPANELRPFSMIKNLVKKGQYAVYGAYNAESLTGYFCVLLSEKSNVILLDYLAVQYGMRGCGVGSSLLNSLIGTIKRDYPEAELIAIECEAPQKTKNLQEMTTRKRRISFYQKNGAVLTNYGWYAFGVEYQLLALAVKSVDLNSVDLGMEVYNLYLSSFNFYFRLLAKKKLRHWKF